MLKVKRSRLVLEAFPISPSIKTQKENSDTSPDTRANENWNDLTTAGAWSKGILWNKPTMRESIKSMENKFDIDIKYKK